MTGNQIKNLNLRVCILNNTKFCQFKNRLALIVKFGKLEHLKELVSQAQTKVYRNKMIRKFPKHPEKSHLPHY